MISPLAHISPNAQLGSNVTVDAFAVIHEDVYIGDDTHIMSGAIIMSGTTIGSGCQVFPGAVLGGIPQDLKFIGEKTTVEIGDNTCIRECVTINRGTQDKWKTVIGSNCLIMAYAHIAHDCTVGNNVILANAVQIAGHVEIGNYATIGGLSAAAQFIKIGMHTYISGNSMIMKDVPPFIKAGRNPLSYAGVNAVGLQRRQYSSETINLIHEAYRYIYNKGVNISQALNLVEQQMPESEERNTILSFIKESKRGIIKTFVKGEIDEN